MHKATAHGAVVTLALALASLAATPGAGARSAALPRGAKVVASIRFPPGTGGLAAGEEAVWALSWAASTLTRIDDPAGGATTSVRIAPAKPCPAFPASCGEAAAGDGGVWVSVVPDDVVVRVDPATDTVAATIPVGRQPEGIAVTPGAVWVANRGDPSVSRIDPATNQVVATIRVAPSERLLLGPHGAGRRRRLDLGKRAAARRRGSHRSRV
jgi:YVTN family beta-propeller protein